MKIEFSTQQKTLIRIQKVLDDHLFYLQNYRGKKKGEFFKSIRSSLIEAAHIFIEIDHIKQLLFIDQSLYIWEWEKDLGSNFDLLINIPPKSDTSSRKIMFAKKVYEFIKDKEKSASNVSLVRIPKLTIQFQQKQKLSAKKYEIVMPTKDFKPKLKQTQINPFDIFKNNDDFKEKLYRGIKEKQQLQKKQKDSTGKINVTKKQILKVLDEVYLAFASSKVQNIFKVSLIQKVNRKLKMRDQIILQAVQIIEQKYPKYLKKINHQKGQILQIDKKEYSQIREQLTLNQNENTLSN